MFRLGRRLWDWLSSRPTSGRPHTRKENVRARPSRPAPVPRPVPAKHPEAKVYFMTGYSADDLLAKARANGALGVFSKPVDLPKMLDTLELMA